VGIPDKQPDNGAMDPKDILNVVRLQEKLELDSPRWIYERCSTRAVKAGIALPRLHGFGRRLLFHWPSICEYLRREPSALAKRAANRQRKAR
jgi:hypothetical protein